MLDLSDERKAPWSGRREGKLIVAFSLDTLTLPEKFKEVAEREKIEIRETGSIFIPSEIDGGMGELERLVRLCDE